VATTPIAADAAIDTNGLKVSVHAPGPMTPRRQAGTTTSTTTAVECRNSHDPQCGEFRWDPSLEPNQPLTVGLSATSESQAGREMRIAVVLDDPDAGSVGIASVDFGDTPRFGGPTHVDCLPPAAYGPWTPPAREHGHSETILRHTYAEPGIYHVVVNAQSGACNPYGNLAQGRLAVEIDPSDGAMIERSDNGGFFTYNPTGAAIAGSAISADEGPDDLHFETYCSADANGHGRCRATLKNQSQRTASFPGGLKGGVNLDHNGHDAGGATLNQPGVTSLAPGQSVDVTGEFQVADPGQYNYAGWTVVHWVSA
jgi:hypothetical protein